MCQWLSQVLIFFIFDNTGDFSLNAANAISAGVLLRTGISRLAPTHDLNSQQIVDLVKILGPKGGAKMEVIIHQHLAVFHTEHCVFCRYVMSPFLMICYFVCVYVFSHVFIFKIMHLH